MSPQPHVRPDRGPGADPSGEKLCTPYPISEQRIYPTINELARR